MFDKLFDFIKSFGRFFMFWDVINPYDAGVVLRLGKFHRMSKVGFNWIWPFMIERILVARSSTQVLVIGPQSLTTKDGHNLVISLTVTCRIFDPKIFLLEIEGGTQAVDDAATGVVSELVMNNSLEDLRKMNVKLRFTNSIEKFAEPWGVDVSKVQIKDFTVMRSLRLIQSVAQTYHDRTEF